MNGIGQLFCGQFCVFLQRFQYLQVGFVYQFSHTLDFYSVWGYFGTSQTESYSFEVANLGVFSESRKKFGGYF
jgi:hypothetical protein